MTLSLPGGLTSRAFPASGRGSSMMLFAALVCVLARPALGAEELRWKFKQGDTVKYLMVQKTTQGVKIMGQELKTDLVQTVDLHWTIKSVSGDGVAELTQTIDRVQTKVEGPGNTFEFDSKSDKTPEGPIASILTPLLKALVNAEFAFKMDGKGELSEIKVPQKLLDSLKNAGPAAGGGGGGMFSEEGLKNMISQSSLTLPEKALDVGDGWKQESRMTMPMIGTMVMDKNYTFQGPAPEKAGLVKIDLNTKVNLEPAADSNVTVKITTQEGKGEFLFDKEVGRVVKSSLDDEMRMTLSIQGQNLEQSTKTVTTMELAK